MSTFTIQQSTLQQLLRINQFQLSNPPQLVFVGIRGCIMTNPNDQDFHATQTLTLMDVNYINPRCTILQWRATDGQLAAFPASTVPNISLIKSAKAQGGVGTNCLITGYYKDYRKGFHKSGAPTGHEAFRQTEIQPIRRSGDDLDFDLDDRIEYDNPQDNIHCGWFDGINADSFSSAGCQVVMGFPKCERPGRDRNVGPWRVFHDNAYGITQSSFPYILLTGTELFNIVTGTPATRAKLRYGSSGPLVEKLQTVLKSKQFYEGEIDGDFGPRTMKAVITFQKNAFGNPGADGVVGAVTAEQLQLDLTM
ncbi:peptidoglycan-binding domain-containing protein [Deminuibacter soli]|uniref:Peptidoglycan binding-like domain-containing protein n=1 Tax=Deminuibacter soli TaxID=2291815 RepID=A0A3E1NEJ4_9BACT|nr:peptidoglycan-binding domain-containing protein [Deminuibacter soli]RFM26400.1 hypothetical protein DXN05_19410 [Deminuibacter soli]